MSYPPPPPFSATWFAFQPCCGGNTLYFSFDGTTNAPNPGISIYIGPAATGYDPASNIYVPLINNQCYRIYRGDAVGPGSPITGANYGNLTEVPTFTPSNYIWDSTTNYETACGDESPGFCPDCITPCYTLFPCREHLPPITLNNSDLYQYLGASVNVEINGGPSTCYYVTQAVSCENAITADAINGECGDCACRCYEIFGTGKLTYVDCDLVQQSIMVNGYWKGCSWTYPFTSPVLTVFEKGLCSENECSASCYELTDCNGVLNNIYSTAQSLSPFATLGQIVQIQGYDNCWVVDSIVDCDCAIDVVVLQAYDTCQECNPAPNYKLINCDDQDTIIYTSSDLSSYVGNVVNVGPDCPGCWLIEEFNFPIPSNVPVTVTTSYNNCTECKKTHYTLEDCSGIANYIVTSTDLSAYVNTVITLDWCPNTCWRVTATPNEPDSRELGSTIYDQFTTCEDCLTSFPCVCSRITNHDTVTHTYSYLACDGTVQTITLLSGKRSERICLAHWLTSYSTDYVEYFNDCINGECPPQIYPKRNVRPGYSTPICSTDKYEKITCKSAEILYKQVLNLRYGISNCCPDEDSKWLLKKEIIDLQALVDPDYTCTHLSCGCAPSTCSCGTTNSCNSH